MLLPDTQSSLKIFVVVIPKEGLVGGTLLIDRAPPTNPCFGMTTAKILRHVFAAHGSFVWHGKLSEIDSCFGPDLTKHDIEWCSFKLPGLSHAIRKLVLRFLSLSYKSHLLLWHWLYTQNPQSSSQLQIILILRNRAAHILEQGTWSWLWLWKSWFEAGCYNVGPEAHAISLWYDNDKTLTSCFCMLHLSYVAPGLPDSDLDQRLY